MTAPDYITVDRTTNERDALLSDDPNFAGSGKWRHSGWYWIPSEHLGIIMKVYAETKGEVEQLAL